MKIVILCLAIIVVLFCGFWVVSKYNYPSAVTPSTSSSYSQTPTESIGTNLNFGLPISDAVQRITKKPFGIFVSPHNSPISPEKFTGYHTGVDFEIFQGEENKDVPIYAICDGQLLQKRTASGYGGVAIQKCQINSQTITVIYGHLKLSSIDPVLGEDISKGQQIAILGKSNSPETDGERKHLHLGIHKGSSIDIKGYVQNKSDLVNWINFEEYVR